MLTLGEKIKSARKAKGLKQSELADILNSKYPELKIGNTTISNYEVNRSKPDIDTLNAIRLMLEVSADYFFEELKKPVTDEGDGLSKEDKEVIDRFKNLSPANKEKMVSYLDFLASQDMQ